MGVTGFSAVTADEGWYIGTKMRVNASVTASYYEPHTNLQFDLSANRYVFGDYGIRGDCTRHFGEYAIGPFRNIYKRRDKRRLPFCNPFARKEMEPKRILPGETRPTILHGLTAWWRMGNISTNKWEKVIIPALTKTEAADSTNLIISVIS